MLWGQFALYRAGFFRHARIYGRSGFASVARSGLEAFITYFDTFGPFDVERMAGSTTCSQMPFWQDVEEQWEGLGQAIGCYVFGIQFGTKITPWYVGKTICANGFKGEVFQPHKIGIYDDCLGKQRGKPVMFLIALMKGENEFSTARKTGGGVINWLERTLMGMAFSQNAKIKNIRDMTFLKNVEVTGLMGEPRRGRKYKEELAIRKTLLGL